MDKKKFDEIGERTIKQFDSLGSANILANIDSYSDEMTISQVVRFFERQGLSFTKTMIQNYVRVGIIPPPVEKRYYVKKHLILLTMIDNLKDIYSLDEIGMLFRPIMKEAENFDDDIMDMVGVYSHFQSIYNDSMNDLLEKIPEIMESSTVKAGESVEKDSDKPEAAHFISLLSIMVRSVVAKKIVKNMMDNESE